MMLPYVFNYIGQSLSAEEAIRKLKALIPNDPYNNAKSLGALGGGVRQRYLVRRGKFFIRVR